MAGISGAGANWTVICFLNRGVNQMEEKIVGVLEKVEGPVQIDELAELVQCTFARQRLTAICTNLIREGRIRSCDVKTKKGKRKAYYIEG